MAYTKLDAGLTDSTIWQAPDTTRIVWITMLAMADQNGYVGASMPGLASRARVSLEACIAAIETFLAPDQWSRTKDNDGRRIAEAEGGWQMLNHAKYRASQNADDRRERSRVAMAKLREKRKHEATPVNSEPALPKLPQAEAEAEATLKEPVVVIAGASAPVTSRPSRGERLSKDFALPKSWGMWALAKYPHWTHQVVLDVGISFKNHWTAKTGKDATKLDWEATWQNWCMSSITQKQYPPPCANGAQKSFRELDADAAADMVRQMTGGLGGARRGARKEIIDAEDASLKLR